LIASHDNKLSLHCISHNIIHIIIHHIIKSRSSKCDKSCIAVSPSNGNKINKIIVMSDISGYGAGQYNNHWNNILDYSFIQIVYQLF
jgi:hypothetical protein